jgi:glucosamine-6-phosphate deaminase
MNMYDFDFHTDAQLATVPFRIFETDIDLYYDMALSMYREIEGNNSKNNPTVFILPVGPVFQYRRFAGLCKDRPLDLSNLHCFFMDEYLDADGALVDARNPLSFRGFVQREFVEALPPSGGFGPGRVVFPHPEDPGEYDRRLEALGGAGACYAGVGINGHLAFNEPPEPGEKISAGDFAALPTRVVALSRETIAINSNTALRGAFELVPKKAVTVGMKQILASRKIRIYCNRPWQSSVVRKLMFAPVSAGFPASLVRDHGDVTLGLTREVAMKPEFALK